MVASAIASLILAAPAAAGPGGHVAGTLTASWDTPGWQGSVSVELEPGEAARDEAVRRIRATEHYRTGQPFSTEGARVTALTSVRSTSYDCGDGTSGGRTSTYGGLVDAETPFTVDRPTLDLLAGTGTISVWPARDNAGRPLPETGRDFFPVPGAVAAHHSAVSCIEGEPPMSEDDVADIFGTRTDVAVPFGIPILLEGADLPLRRDGTGWSAAGRVEERVLGSLPVTLRFDLRMAGPLKGWTALCTVPGDRALARARSPRAALAVVRRAGWPRARYAGRRAARYHRRGRYFVDEKFTSSGMAGCLTGRPKVFLAR